MLQATALNLGHAIGVVPQNHGGVYRPAAAAAALGLDLVAVGGGNGLVQHDAGGARGARVGPQDGIQGGAGAHSHPLAAHGNGLLGSDGLVDGHHVAGGRGGALGGHLGGAAHQHGGLEDLGLGGLHKAHARDAADLALIPVLGVVVLYLLPLGVVGQVIGHVGVDDAHKAVADLVGVLGLQGPHSLLDVVHGQVAVAGCGFAAAHQAGPAGHAAGVDDVGAAVHHFPGDGVQSSARLVAQQLGGLHQVAVNGGQHQDVRQGDVAAVLPHLAGDGGHGQALAVGGHALLQHAQQLGQGAVLAELDDLAAILGNGVLLGKLVVYQLGQGVVDQVVAVIYLHLVGQAVGMGGLGVQVGKQL